jgi:murein DD-endopeptidase MepM/ murein hydrolase activator NlpD
MRRLMVILVALAAVTLVGPMPAVEAAPGVRRAVAPLDGVVVREFDPPEQSWLAGHRGVDVAGQVGDLVVAAAAGQVRFAGPVAGRPVVSIAHGTLVTTYEPVTPLVAAGDLVEAGAVIGRLEAGHCGTLACLHWGLKEATTYLDPRSLLSQTTVRLIPVAAVTELERQRAEWERAQAAVSLTRPVPGPITSPFGYRINPITGAAELHDGTDFGSPCGTPIQAVAAGVVTQRSTDTGFGNRVFVDHGTVAGHHLVSSYNHLSGFALEVGAAVAPGDVIGYVGTTGLSTGCHLHLILRVDGALVDPMTQLG